MQREARVFKVRKTPSEVNEGSLLGSSVEEYDMGQTGVERIHGDALGGTSHDAQDMYRMAKKQELRVSLAWV